MMMFIIVKFALCQNLGKIENGGKEIYRADPGSLRGLRGTLIHHYFCFTFPNLEICTLFSVK